MVLLRLPDLLVTKVTIEITCRKRVRLEGGPDDRSIPIPPDGAGPAQPGHPSRLHARLRQRFRDRGAARCAAAGHEQPQKCNYGLYGEQLSGTAFTAPSHQNERTWCYRIRPSVKHSRRFQKIDLPYWKSRAARGPDVISLGQYRWDPVPHSDEPLTWLTGMRTMTTAGDVNTQVGMASHIYLVTASMEDAYFYSADSELLIVPQEGKLRFFTELGIIDLEPQEIAIIPRGLVYRVEVTKAPRAASSARITARNSSCRAWADRRQLHGQPARFQDAGRGLRGPRGAVDRHREMVRPVPRDRDRAFARSTSWPGTATTRR
jgi:hypothetical protein